MNRTIHLILILGLLGCSFWGTSCSPTRGPVPSVESYLETSPGEQLPYARDEEWWKHYGDEQLNNLVETALKNNIDYQKTIIAILKSKYHARLADADLLPSLSSDSTASRTKETRDGTQTQHSYTSDIQIRYEVDLWLKLSDTASAREWEYHASELDREAAKLILITSAIEYYFHLSYLDSALQIAQESLNNYQAIYSSTKSKHQFGKVSLLEVEQALQSVLSAERTCFELSLQQQENLEALRRLLNLRPDESLDIGWPDIHGNYFLDIDLEVPMAVLVHRPDLRAAEYRLQSAFKDIRAAQKSWLPTISLQAALSGTAEHARRVWDAPQALGALSLSLPFLDWKTIHWNIKLAEAEYDEVKLNYEKLLNEALNETATAVYNTKITKHLLTNAEQRFNQAEKISNIYQHRYSLGKAEFSDWLEAVNQSFDAKQQLVQARYELLKAENTVFRVMAGRYTANSNK